MQFLQRLGIEQPGALIDWEMTPIDTFAMFESRGDMERVKSTGERYYYFYVDNWVKPSRLCLMERGIRFARVLARIHAPQELIDACVTSQGSTYKEQSYAITQDVRAWLEQKVIEPLDMSLLKVFSRSGNDNLPASGLPLAQGIMSGQFKKLLRSHSIVIDEREIAGIVQGHNFFDSLYNPQGFFPSKMVDNGDNLTVTDLATGLVWLRSGSDHGSRRKLLNWINAINKKGLAGFADWRLPTVEEGMTLLRPNRNEKGFYVDPCFTPEQGYIFTSDSRKPGGYWFIDLRQARVYWAGGTLSGGFCRPCRSITEELSL